jgi:FAD/FMN-containing dehydrogenase
MIATSCSGTNAARYGTMKDGWVLGMKVVLADGFVIRTKGRTKKSSAGFDLNRLMIGSEGTLGIVTEITLKLTTVPKYTSVITCAFDAVEVGILSSDTLSSVLRELGRSNNHLAPPPGWYQLPMYRVPRRSLHQKSLRQPAYRQRTR